MFPDLTGSGATAKEMCPMGKFTLFSIFFSSQIKGKHKTLSMEEKALQEKCLEMLKHVTSANAAVSVETANNTWYSLCVVQLEG